MGQPPLPAGNLEEVTLFWRAKKLRNTAAGYSKLVGLSDREGVWACLICYQRCSCCVPWSIICSEETWQGIACRGVWGAPQHRANGDWRLHPASKELPHHSHMISHSAASGLKWDTPKRAHFSVKAQNILPAMASVSATKWTSQRTRHKGRTSIFSVRELMGGSTLCFGAEAGM